MNIITNKAIAYPTYRCSREEFEKELEGMPELKAKFGKNYIKAFNKGFDCRELEGMSCMKPIIPKCLTMLNMKTLSGKQQAARVLLDTAHAKGAKIPGSILYTEKGTVRVDNKRFTEFSNFIDSVGTDLALGELFGKPHNWSWYCYVKEESYVRGREDTELPIINIFSSPEIPVGLYYVGDEGKDMIFMHSNVNLSRVLNK